MIEKQNAPNRQGHASEPKPSGDNESERPRPLDLARIREGGPPETSASKDGKVEREGAKGLFLEIFGTANHQLVRSLLGQVFGTTPDTKMAGALAALRGIGPRDELEGLLAVQMVGVHNLAMEFMGRAALNGQTVEGVSENVHRATRMLRTFLAQMEALNRHRGKGEQKVIVKHVHVQEGGQAIVGTITQNRQGEGGSNGKS